MPFKKFIIEIRDNSVFPIIALAYCQAVMAGGYVSGSEGRKQHCYHTVFKSGVTVTVVRNDKSERFIVSREKGQ